MKWIVMIMLACSVGLTIGCEAREDATPAAPPAPTSGAEPSDPEPMPATGPATKPSAAAAAAAVNQYCAVMSEHKVDPKVTVAHAGKTIGFCCEDCIPDFQKDPAKYMASLK